MSTVIACERGCGERLAGGIYLEVGFGPHGQPPEAFLIDPPMAVDPDALGLSPVGVTLVRDPGTGVTHVFDWVGSEHYPNVADFCEEFYRFGVSRRAARTIDFSALTTASRLVLLHSRAIIVNRQEYYASRTPTMWTCPKKITSHYSDHSQHFREMCIRLWWEDVEGGLSSDDPDNPRRVIRRQPSFSYLAHRRPAGATPLYHLGIFANLPIHQIAVIRDPLEETHEAAATSARRSKIQVNLEDR